MLQGATARRYAEAAFELGSEHSSLDRWQSDLRTIAEYFGNRQLAFILSEPNIPFERKDQVVRELLGGKVKPDALGLALLLVERNLVSLAPRVRDEFERHYDEYRGQVHAEITTAAPLDEEMRERVRRDLAEITGKRIILHEQVDPSILGGAVARVGDTLIDGSVRRRLALLRQQIIKGGATFGGPSDGTGGTDGRGATLDRGPQGGAGGGGEQPFVVTPSPDLKGNGTYSPKSNGGQGGTP
jgi:F-type H+-transporting ATPase subunit delta